MRMRTMPTIAGALSVATLVAWIAVPSAATGVWWGQWGQNAQHRGSVAVAGQTGSNILANIVYDPFTDKEQNGPYAAGDLLVHYQTPLLSGNDVFMEFKTGQFSNIKNWQVQTWAGAAKAAEWSTLVPGAPAATDRCTFRYSTLNLPWPVLNADGTPAPVPTVACGSQRPPVNTAPAIGADGTIYDISRASLDDYYGYLIAINKDLTPRWASSMRNRFHDGCGS